MTSQDAPEPTPTTTEPDTPETSAAVPDGFVPPEGAARARFRRLNLDTGGWEDAQVLVDGVRTCVVDAETATPNLPLVDQVPTNHRITWYTSTGRIVGYSRNWRPFGSADSPGGASNTPRKWPAVQHAASAMPQGTGNLTPQDALTYQRGLTELAQTMAGPIVAMLHQFSNEMLTREREFFQQQISLMQTQHEHRLQQDRQFLASVRELEQAPRDREVQELKAKLAELEADAQEAAEAEENAAPEDPTGMQLAAVALENAPAIIREVATQARAVTAPPGTPPALPDVEP